MNKLLQVLIIDDSPLFRSVIKAILKQIENVEIVGVASNGEIGVKLAASLQPDFVTVDIEMPVMDGVTAVRKIKEIRSDIFCVMISNYSSENGVRTIEALENGADDVIEKSIGADLKANEAHLLRQLREKIDVCRLHQQMKGSGTNDSVLGAVPIKNVDPAAFQLPLKKKAYKAPGLILIGISTGGPVALSKFLSKMPSAFNVPIIIVQHMPASFIPHMVKSLNEKSALTVEIAKEGQQPLGGHVYIAPGEQQLKLIKTASGRIQVHVTDDPPENFCKPSVDYLFRTAARLGRSDILGIIMTGMGHDGALGVEALRACGAVTLAQSQISCTVFGMPKSAIDSGCIDRIFDLDALPELLVRAQIEPL